MLMLIEPPGAKRGTSLVSRSQNHLLGAAGDDDIDVNDFDVSDDFTNASRSFLQKIDGLLVGKSNSGDFSERWKRQFSERPSWCDADMTLQQIKRVLASCTEFAAEVLELSIRKMIALLIHFNMPTSYHLYHVSYQNCSTMLKVIQGKAVGNRASLYSRSFIQKVLYLLGSFVQRRAFLVIFSVTLLFGMCCYGLQFVRIETDIVKLWVAKGGRLDEELNFLSVVEKDSVVEGDAQRENGLGGTYQVVIQVPREEGQNILNQRDLLEHVSLMEQIAKYSVNVGGVNWTLPDICFKPPSPEIDDSSIAKTYISVIDRIVPCIWITPIDCFWEGSKAVGPHPPVKTSSLGFATYFLKSLQNSKTISWSNIDPEELIKQIGEIVSLGDFHSFFYRAGIGRGYLDRWCIDPLDPDCPESSPNYFDFCNLMPRFLEYAQKKGVEVLEDPDYSKSQTDSSEDFFNWDSFLGSKKKREVSHSEGHFKNSLSDVSGPVTFAAHPNATNFNMRRPESDSKLHETTLQYNSMPAGVTDDQKFVGHFSSTKSSLKAFDIVHDRAGETNKDKEIQIDLNGDGSMSGKRRQGAIVAHANGNGFDELYDYDEEEMEVIRNALRCKKYGRYFSEWMKNNVDKWHEFLNQSEFPVNPDFGKIMDGGCHGFAKKVMSWPQDLIIGGIKKSGGHLNTAEALQSVILVASPQDIYLRFKDASKSYLKPGLNLTKWNYSEAEKVIAAWQRKFTQNLYDHEFNNEIDLQTGKKHRRVHPLAATSIADMLEEFCQFNYTIILVGYFLMLLYTVQSQMKLHGCKLATDSCMGLAFAGVLTVTFASIAGLGFATWCGIEFNAATTQIVPFLTLGIGVDNMFLLLHNYHGVVDNMRKNEIGMLMKETGMSVVMTSFNNILSFLAGTILPIPALRSFCAQSSILLTFNLIAILTIYPAIISLDLHRRKSSRRDIFCCCVAEGALEESYAIAIGVKTQMQQKRTVGDGTSSYRNLYCLNDRDDVESDVKPWTLHAFLRNYYVPFLKNSFVKVLILATCFLMFCGGIVGMYHASYGLELSDVLPESTAPAAFLKARDKYFSFYPMFAILKGPNIDYPNLQNKIDNYRDRIARSKYVVKVEGEPSEKYWLALMRSWLSDLQKKLDAAIANNKFELETGNVINATASSKGSSKELTVEEKVAYLLVCSYGNAFNCSDRLGKIRLVDPSNTINAEGFYNYVTAWYNLDSMMYHVSQASFIPAPPRWSFESSPSQLVPPAQPFAYSQIPFYLTGLTDTSGIVDMITEIRAVCDEFTAQGLPNFPSGVAFTFWEQYMHLSSNLVRAIGVIALSVFCVISIILLNPWAAGIIMVILLLMTVELAGFLGVAGIKMNPVSAVTIITAVGIGVEFTAHVVLAFLTSLGARNDRMAACIDRVFVPVIHGALSTLLGIIMLAFSEFEFVIKYFFIVMSALIAIGVINGLALLPVLLSLIGPNCEVTPVDGTARLSPPPSAPPKKKRRKNVIDTQTHRRNISDDSNTATLGPEISSTVLLLDPARNAPTTGIRVNAHARSVSAHINTQNYSSGAHYESLDC